MIDVPQTKMLTAAGEERTRTAVHRIGAGTGVAAEHTSSPAVDPADTEPPELPTSPDGDVLAAKTQFSSKNE
jgi:hypothetical protein